LVVAYWSEVAANMPDWLTALNKTTTTSELRENYIHAHAVMLQAMGQIGADLLAKPEAQWKKTLKKLRKVDWSRSNKQWEGRALAHGRISKARTNVLLTGNYIKKQLDIPLNNIEEAAERAFK